MGVAYIFVEELEDKVVQPASLLVSLLIIPCLGVDLVSRDEFKVIHLLERDFREGFFILCQVQVLTLMERDYGYINPLG